jgi:addiction module HigA family antidote
MKAPKLIPARSLGVGYFIEEQIEFRGWSLKELADFMKIDVTELIAIINNTSSITIEFAKTLANVFGTSYQYWLNLDSNHKMIIARTGD